LQGQGNLKSIKFKILFDHHFKEEVLAGKSQDQREVSPLSPIDLSAAGGNLDNEELKI